MTATKLPDQTAIKSPTNRVSAQVLGAMHPAPPKKPLGMLLAGVGLLVAAGWIGWIWFRRSRPAAGPSLITQSFDKNRK